MNICFRILAPRAEKDFLSGATALGLAGLKGHRSVGGIRASNYNSVPLEGAGKLAQYLETFATSTY
jgi:phosphoserine aminotransferase